MGMAEGLAWSWLFPNNSLPSKAVGPMDSVDLWDKGKTHCPCAVGDHCDARDAGNSKAPTNLEAQKAITQAQGNTTDRLRRGESASCQKKKQQKNPKPNQRQLR